MSHHSKRQELAGQRAEKQRLAPFMRALRAIHSVTTPDTMNVEDLARQLKTVTKDQVVEAAQSLRLDTIYFLKGVQA